VRVKTGWLLSVVLMSAVFMAACGGSESGGDTADDAPTPTTRSDTDPALVEAAKKEGKIVFYNGQNPERAALVTKAFETKYPGIKVETLRLAGSQLTARYDADSKAGNVPDLMSSAGPAFYKANVEKGTFLKLSAEEVPSYANWPKEYSHFGDTAARISITPWRVIVNTDRVTDAQTPKTWQDLLKPEFKGEIVYVDPRIIFPSLAQIKVWKDELGEDYTSKLAAQDLTIVESAVPGIQGVAAGEHGLLVSTEPGVADPLIKEGAPLKHVLVTPTIGTEMFMAVSAKAPHPNAARLLMDYMLSPEGQEIANGGGGRVSPLPNIPNTDKLPAGFVPTDGDAVEAERDTLTGLMGLN
jgi:iron(III) transport system substrate-binding protein